VSNDENKKTAEEMSLEELLGHQGGAPTDDYDDLDEDQKRNEAGSGLINLAAMVGSGMLENKDNAAPTNAFDAAKAANVASGKEEAAPVQAATPAQPRASSHQMDGAVQQQPAKKSPLGLIIGIAAAVIIAGVVSMFVFSSGDDAEKKKKEALAQMNADLAAMLEKSQNAVGEEKDAIDAEIAKTQAGIAAVETADAEDIEEAMDFGDEEPEEDDVEGMEIEENEAGGTTARKRRTRTASSSTAASTATKETAAPEVKAEAETKKTLTASLTATAPKKTVEKKTTAPAPTEKAKKTAALSSLLTSSATKSDGGLPETPSRAQVTKAMGKVTAKAKGMCGKQGGGKVKIRVTVGSNGKVRDSLPLGEHSSSTLGRCVSTIARKTGTFPKFKKPTFTFTYPVSI